jgi:Carboxypeptidase regulatory-like domain
MRTRVLVAGLLLAILAAGAGAAPQNGLGTVGGSVFGPNGQAIRGARVTLQSADGTHPQTTVTNAEGRFWFPMLPKGLYDVRAYSNGRASEWRKNVWAEPGRQNTVALRLQSQKPVARAVPASVYFH